MNGTDLLADFRGHRSEAAFGELVRRYTNLVYSVAKRRLSNVSLAQEVTQIVFIRLARSVPNLRGEVKRVTHIRVRAWDREGNAIDREVKGLTAGTFQHEVDHLDGKLFVDRVFDTRSLCTWQEFERHHQAAFVERARALVARFGS